MQNAALSKSGKSLKLARLHSTLALPVVANQIRRLFGPRGTAARQDVKLAADLDTVSEEEEYAARVAYRKTKKEKKGEKSGWGSGLTR